MAEFAEEVNSHQNGRAIYGLGSYCHEWKCLPKHEMEDWTSEMSIMTSSRRCLTPRADLKTRGSPPRESLIFKMDPPRPV